MTSERYKSLPDLDTAPATYETPDLTSAPTSPSSRGPPSPSVSEWISSAPLDATAARSRFGRTELDSHDADFSGRGRHRGWKVHQRPETRTERIARLHREIEEIRDMSEDENDEGLISELANVEGKTSIETTNGSPIEIDGRVGLLDERLARLEKQLGSLSNNNIAKTVDLLVAKVSVVTATSASIDETARRLASLTSEADKFSESGANTKLEGLYAALDAINELSPTLPLVLDRLRTLRAIHEDAGTVKSGLDTIEENLKTRAKEIVEWREALDLTEKHLREGKQVLDGSVQHVRKVVEELEKKIIN